MTDCGDPFCFGRKDVVGWGVYKGGMGVAVCALEGDNEKDNQCSLPARMSRA